MPMQQGGSLWRTGIARAFLPCQMLLAFAGILTIVFAPRGGGEAVLLYPLSEQANGAMIAALSQPDTDILSVGQLAGSYVIRGNRPDFLSSLARDGILVLRASAPGCGPALVESVL